MEGITKRIKKHSYGIQTHSAKKSSEKEETCQERSKRRRKKFQGSLKTEAKGAWKGFSIEKMKTHLATGTKWTPK